MGITVEEAASINRLAVILSPLVTNANINDVAEYVGLMGAGGSNKTERIRSMLTHLFSDRRRRSNVESMVLTLTMRAHGRAVDGKVVMTHEQVDSIVTELRRLGLNPGQLAQKRWRAGLDDGSRTVVSKSGVATSPTPASVSSPDVLRPKFHDDAYRHLQELTRPGANPHVRGRQLEAILFDVLRAEALHPQKNIVIPGEEIDLAFVLDAQHYLVECKWEQAPCGLADIHLFSRKARTKAEGTFGVMLSMAGFVSDVNVKASRGERLNCIGIGPRTFVGILEGREMWSAAVRAARSAASTRSLFFAEE